MSVNSHLAFWLSVPAFAPIMALPMFAESSGVPRIAYVCGPTSSYHVCLVDPDGSNPVSIGPTIKLSAYLPPAWSHDGAKIAFTNMAPSNNGDSDIYAMDSNGANVTRLVDGSQFPNVVPPHNVQWSPDGSRIVFIDALNDGLKQYFSASTSGGGSAAQLTTITTQPGFSGAVSRPSWSPDGKHILGMFANPFPNYGLYSVDPGSGALTLIVAGRYVDPAWSPDGSQIVYTDETSIFIMDKDGSNARLVAVGGSSTNNVRWPSWSPDGTKIVFSTAATNQLFIVNTDGSGLHAIPGVTGLFPDWQPPVNPIILIPGFLGSKMVCGASELWPNLPLPGPDFLDMRLGPDGVSNLVPGCGAQVGDIVDTAIVPIYKPALDFLDQIAPDKNYNFPWDWRTSPENSLSALDAFIDDVRQKNHGNKVVLMAHSMGGLLARWYIDDPTRAAKVDRMVTIGTPYWGSPKALFPLAAGIEIPGFNPLDLFVKNSDLQSWAINALGLYFLYPSANYGPWLTVTDKSPTPLSPAGLLDYIGNTLGGNSALLSQGLNGHATTLDGFKTNGVKYRVVAGTGLNTIGAINIHPPDVNGRNVDLTLISGDQTVPGISANQGPLGSQAPLGEAVPIYYACNVGHTDLPGDPSVTKAIKGFLLTGDDVKGLDTPCSASGFEMDLIQISNSGSPAPPLSMTNAELAGLIDVLRFAKQTTVVTDSARPASFELPAGTVELVVTPVQSGSKGNPSFYGPLNGTITVSANTAVTVLQNGAAVQPAPGDAPLIGGIVNGGSFVAGQAIAPGSIVSIFGSKLAPDPSLTASTIPLPLSLNNVSVTINGEQAPLYFVSSGQINVQAPWDLDTSGPATVLVSNNGTSSPPAQVSTLAVSPAVLSYMGDAIAINLDGHLALAPGTIPGLTTHPVARGDAIQLYATGLGAVDHDIPKGGIPASGTVAFARVKPTVLLNGTAIPDADVIFWGLTPQFVGVNQVNIIIPPDAPTGDTVSIQISTGGITSPATAATLAIQ